MSGTDSRVGTDFGPYHLKRLLGRGGMGEVYEAYDTRKDRTVALKLLLLSVSHDPVFRARLQREAASSGRLHEPHVVPIHDYGEIDGVLFIEMRLIDGGSLRELLSHTGPLAPSRAVAIIRQVASALDAAHAAGILHRDVKPENILVTGDDFAYLVDFGIANAATDDKITEMGTAVGTYAYMAPERFTDAEVTHRADIYSLACVFHECLTGGQPYTASNVSSLITSHLMRPIPTPSAARQGIPTALDDVISRGMAKDPQHRYATASDLAMAAHHALGTGDQNAADSIVAHSESSTTVTSIPAPPPAWMPPPLSGPSPPPSSAPTAWMPPVPSGPVSWQQQPPLSGPWPPAGPQKKRNWVAVAVVAAVVVAVAGVATVVVLLLNKPSNTKGNNASGPGTSSGRSSPEDTPTNSKTRTSTSSTRPSTTAASTRLMGLLPEGFDESTCKPVTPADDALATVACGASSNPGGPRSARFSVFPDQQKLDQMFELAIGSGDGLLVCPDSTGEAPTTWHYQETPDTVEGQVACANSDGSPSVLWTRNEDLLMGDAQGADLNSVHEWWVEFG
jgi:serine/threonine protein kinase